MLIKILDTKEELGATCYLCKVDLATYIKSIPKTYREFDVQRGIVTNRYLDHLADSIHLKKHIPPIVLVAENLKRNEKNNLTVASYRILDGLQRTHRLKVIWDMVEFIVGKKIEIPTPESTSAFVKKHSNEIRKLGGDLKLVRNLISFRCNELDDHEEFFSGNNLWLEVWDGLNQADQIDKMLLLNAGHKSVNIKHQLELLFLSTLIRLDDLAPKGVKFVREKDQSSIQYSKNRELGQYHSAHLISALIALSAGKVINTNSDLVSDMQFDQSDFVDLVEGFNLSLMKEFIKFLYLLDQQLDNQYRDIGIKWLGREVVLIGLFAAIGKYAEETSQTPLHVLKELGTKLPKIILNLKLLDFEKERNKVELNKVNVGNINKRAVFSASYDLFQGEKFKGWDAYFRRGL